MHAEKREFPQATESYLKSLDIMAKGSDSVFVAMIYNHLGVCYGEQDLHSIARGIYKKAYNLCVIKDSVRACYTLKDIGDTFLFEDQIDSTFNYYNQGIELAASLQNFELLSFLYQNVAAVYNDQNKYVEAEICI